MRRQSDRKNGFLISTFTARSVSLCTQGCGRKRLLDYRSRMLNLDSSLTARQELAKELGYSGNTKGSSKMNVWLHKEVMRQLAANGGKVPKTWMA